MNIPTTPRNKSTQELAIAKESQRFKNSFLFINTDFKRTTQPIFILAFCESQRRVRLDLERLLFKSDDEILQIVSQFVKDDFYTSDAKAGVWGKIVSYIWNHRDEETYIFHTDGSYEKIDIKPPQVKATLSVKGRTIC
jgi:hypothetical protein